MIDKNGAKPGTGWKKIELGVRLSKIAPFFVVTSDPRWGVPYIQKIIIIVSAKLHRRMLFSLGGGENKNKYRQFDNPRLTLD